MKKRKKVLLSVLLVFLVLFVALLIRGFWEGQQVEVTHTEVLVQSLPEDLAGVRIVQVSDLHGRHLDDDDFWKTVSDREPDLIALTGDMLDHSQGEEEMQALLLRLADLSRLCPVYYVTGNHEEAWPYCDTFTEALSACGVHVLENESETLRIGDSVLRIVGIFDAVGMENQFLSGKDHEAQIEDILRSQDLREEETVVLLAHRPDFIETYANFPVDLVLAGHTHGGVIQIPFVGAILAPNQGFFPDYEAGLYSVNGTNLFVSRGLGGAFRLFCLPEISVIELTSLAG